MAIDPSQSPLFAGQAPESATALAASLAAPAAPGHFDELRGTESRLAPPDATDSIAEDALLTGTWGQFFSKMGLDGITDLPRRQARLARQIRDNGVTYNVYADAQNVQRPWALDLFPLILAPQDWAQIERGVSQRASLLNAMLADAYGPRRLLKDALLPAALVQGHPGYMRAMHGSRPVGGLHLHIAAFDLARGPDGAWRVVSQRTQAPSGLGYLLENRLIISRLFPEAFREMHVQRLAATYRALVDKLKRDCAGLEAFGGEPHIALLTPGPYNETYFEHAYLARYLGLTLVEGSDLTVRGERLYLKTLRGLEPVHGLLKRLDDEYLDPLELRSDSTLGVPGLMQAVRAGKVLVANAPGSAWLESPALLGFLPALCRELLGEDLAMPSMSTWWCGERAALDDALPHLAQSLIKPTYPGTQNAANFQAAQGARLSRRELDEWSGRILRQGEDHTVQASVPLSQMPTWVAGEGQQRIAPRSIMLRVFAIADNDANGNTRWRVLPGGMARIATEEEEVASMQRGGSSADVWVLADVEHGEQVDQSTLLRHDQAPHTAGPRQRTVTSRAAENLFWLGRYTERTENAIRLARHTLECLTGEEQASQPLLAWLSELARRNGLVLPDVPGAAHARRVFERSLIAALIDPEHSSSVGYNLASFKRAASTVRERLSQEQWNVMVLAEQSFLARSAELSASGEYSTVEALALLDSVSRDMAAITGAQTDRMTRDDGWRLLSIGRLIERLGFLSHALEQGFGCGGLPDDESTYGAMLALFDSTITFHAQYQQRRDLGALVELLVQDRDNPRSLGWVAATLRGRLSKLAGAGPGELDALAQSVPDPSTWPQPGEPVDELVDRLLTMLEETSDAAWHLSDDISARYFSHADAQGQSL